MAKQKLKSAKPLGRKTSQSRAQEMGKSTGPDIGAELQRPRETFEGSRGTLFPPPVGTWNKHSDCPQNPEHLPPPQPAFM